MTSAIALIPARGGSKRVPKKNIRPLNGHPLIAYTICAAKDSGCFKKVLVSSDDTETLEIATGYGADVIRRPDALATDTSPDIEWVKHALSAVISSKFRTVVNGKRQFEFPVFSILRPTSPFRLSSTIHRAFSEWQGSNIIGDTYTSLRGVERVSQHPGKMWYMRPKELVPMLPQPAQPYHDSQMASLPEVWTQNASLEIAWTSTVEETGTISGCRVLPFLTRNEEGFDINSEYDWMVAEQMVLDGVELPNVP